MLVLTQVTATSEIWKKMSETSNEKQIPIIISSDEFHLQKVFLTRSPFFFFSS